MRHLQAHWLSVFGIAAGFILWGGSAGFGQCMSGGGAAGASAAGGAGMMMGGPRMMSGTGTDAASALMSLQQAMQAAQMAQQMRALQWQRLRMLQAQRNQQLARQRQIRMRTRQLARIERENPRAISDAENQKRGVPDPRNGRASTRNNGDAMN